MPRPNGMMICELRQVDDDDEYEYKTQEVQKALTPLFNALRKKKLSGKSYIPGTENMIYHPLPGIFHSIT